MIWLWFTLGVVGHEVSHFAAARLLGLNAKFAWKRGFGVMYWVGDGETVKVASRDKRLVSLAGPLFNIALAFVVPQAFVPNILLGIGNLIPVKGSDGYNIVKR